MADKRRRYKQRDNNAKKEYQRLVRNTKSKINRIRDNWGIDVSDKVNLPSFSELDTPEKFDKWSDEMIEFTDRNNKNFQFEKNKWGVVFSVAELEEGKRNTEIAQKNAQELIDKYKQNPYSREGKETGYTVGERMMLFEKENVAGITVPDAFDIDAFQSRSRLEGRLELLDEKASGKFFDQSMERMKNNFMKSLRGTFNSDADEIIDMIDIIPPDDFFELFIMKAEFTFEDYASDGSIDATETQLERLKSYLLEYFRGEIDFDLKSF